MLESILTACSGFQIRLLMVGGSSNSQVGARASVLEAGGLRTASANRAGHGEAECCWVTPGATSPRADLATEVCLVLVLFIRVLSMSISLVCVSQIFPVLSFAF